MRDQELTAAELLRLNTTALKKVADWLHDYGRPERINPAEYGDDFLMTYADCDMVEKSLRLVVHNITMVAADLERAKARRETQTDAGGDDAKR